MIKFVNEIKHLSDCAVNNGPALPVGECDCGAEIERLRTLIDGLMEAVEPFANGWERFEVSVDVDNEWLKSEISDGVTWGDLRALTEAYLKAKGE